MRKRKLETKSGMERDRADTERNGDRLSTTGQGASHPARSGLLESPLPRRRPSRRRLRVTSRSPRLELRLRRRETRDRHPVGRAGHVVEARPCGRSGSTPGRRRARRRRRSSASASRCGPSCTPISTSWPTPPTSMRDERVLLEEPVLLVVEQELAGVVAREAEAHLGEVVGAEREELGLLRDLVGGHRAARDLDHRADQVLDARAAPCRGRACASSSTIAFCRFSSSTWPTSGIMTSGLTGMPFFDDLQRRLEDRPRLHARDLGVRDAEAAAAVAEHRVELVQLLDRAQQLLLARRSSRSSCRPSPRGSRPRPSAPRASGRNSCSGGSSVRMVTGVAVHLLEEPGEVGAAASAAAS